MNTIKIGKSTLNLIDCELNPNKTPIKESLLQIVRDRNVLEYPSIIEEKASIGGKEGYEYLYHLSDIRGNIVRFLPIEKNDRVLEIEAECGGITAALVKMSDNVTVFTNSATDAEILAQRFSNCKNFVIYAGENDACFEEICEKSMGFDWIIVRNPRLLQVAKKLVNATGRIVFITDNRMGLKFLAGAKADGEEEYFTGIEGKSESGFTFSGLRKLFSINGFSDAQMFYPYPDYRFMKSVYSNSHLPKTGELVDNLRNFDSERLSLFSEKEAFDAACEDGSFQYYSNSYLVILGEPICVEYARFSNDRAPEYAIYTAIEKRFGERTVRKYPLTEAANEHIRSIGYYYKKLSERYAGSNLSINKCNIMDVGDKLSADFEYVSGVELSKLMDSCLSKEDYDSFYALFDKYVSLTGYNEDAGIADLDMVFSNILVNKDEWTLIDYEWCKEGHVPVKETAYRAIYCYLLEDKGRDKFNHDLLLSKLVLSKEASEDIEADEAIFQKKVTGRNLSIQEIRERLNFKVINPLKSSIECLDNSEIYKFRVYPGGSTGEFSEDTAFDIGDAYKSETNAKALISVMADDTVMRVDPLDAPCIVTIRECKLGELDFPIENKKYLVGNGKRIGSNTFVFDTSDPNLYFDLDGFIHDEDTFLYVDMDIFTVPADTAKNISDNIKRLF